MVFIVFDKKIVNATDNESKIIIPYTPSNSEISTFGPRLTRPKLSQLGQAFEKSRDISV